MHTAFIIWSSASLILLIFLASWIGHHYTTYGKLGILVDSRGRYSLTHLQVVAWTLVILATFLGILVANGFDTNAITIPTALLGLMGVSAGSAVLATGAKAAKDASGANVARAGRAGITPRLGQIWLEEEGDLADKVISVTKFQNFVFTLVALIAYVTLAVGAGAFPELPQEVVWLLGISHAGYVGGKVPDKK